MLIYKLFNLGHALQTRFYWMPKHTTQGEAKIALLLSSRFLHNGAMFVFFICIFSNLPSYGTLHTVINCGLHCRLAVPNKCRTDQASAGPEQSHRKTTSLSGIDSLVSYFYSSSSALVSPRATSVTSHTESMQPMVLGWAGFMLPLKTRAARKHRSGSVSGPTRKATTRNGIIGITMGL